ncbi:MAG: serine acetyltransferase [Acidobacteria bacterium]|nr:MAG: serine acetyltransferase [Acidobacteriota bacterium]REK07277.1 MAG: serine acetyltransferase [Acidobacteriota bacterium]
MFQLLQADFRRLAALRGREGLAFALQTVLFDNGFQAVFGYRVASALKRLGLPLLPAIVWRWTIFCTGVDVNPRARFGRGLVISHGVGLVVGADVTVGENCLLHHQVTLGAPTVGRISENPRLGHDVTVGAGAVVLGGIEVGDRAVIGAAALVIGDVPAGALALAPAARLRDAPPETERDRDVRDGAGTTGRGNSPTPPTPPTPATPATPATPPTPKQERGPG